jgi:4a-hydroxytetrahydrobiopterin dehydratase
MTDVCDLGARDCEPCRGGVPPMEMDAARGLMAQIDPAWVLSEDGTMLSRRFEFKNFGKAMQLANAVGFVGEQQGHHPDIAFGWGYCSVTWSTHEIGGLSENDFICAARVDAILR